MATWRYLECNTDRQRQTVDRQTADRQDYRVRLSLPQVHRARQSFAIYDVQRDTDWVIYNCGISVWLAIVY